MRNHVDANYAVCAGGVMEFKKISARLSASEYAALEAYRARNGLRTLDAAVKMLIAAGKPK